MLRLSILSLLIALATSGSAQTMDLVVFADDGTKFTLLVDGEQKNDSPAARVVATGIRTQTPNIIVRFADTNMPQINKSLYLELGMEYTIKLTTNKKGERVLRPSGEAALGSASNNVEPDPANFQEDTPAAVAPNATYTALPTDEVLTTTVVEETDGTGEAVGVKVDINGVGFNMNVNVDDGVGSTTTTRTTTTTTRTSTTTLTPVPEPTAPKVPVTAAPPVYDMPGYTGRHGCNWPMSSTEFNDVKTSVESKSFEDTKMTLAKQVGSNRCFTVDQVKGIMGLFSFEDSKLDFAKYAYDRTFDIDNYFKVSDGFTFDSSTDELNSYIQGR